MVKREVFAVHYFLDFGPRRDVRLVFARVWRNKDGMTRMVNRHFRSITDSSFARISRLLRGSVTPYRYGWSYYPQTKEQKDVR